MAPTTTGLVSCEDCHEQISFDLDRAIGALFDDDRAPRLDKLHTLIREYTTDHRWRKESDEEHNRRIAVDALETWLDCDLALFVEAVRHHDLDKDSVWCEHCNQRVPDTMYKMHGDMMLCGGCYETITNVTTPQEEGRKS